MKISQLRTYEADRTTGRILVDGIEIARTVEDIGRPHGIKIPKQTCLPEGLYKASITHSPAFKRRMILLFTNPKTFACELENIAFTGIRVHYGLTVGHTDGCVCVTSTEALDNLFALINEAEQAGEEIMWEIGRDTPAVRIAA